MLYEDIRALFGSVNVACGQVGGITFTDFRHDLKRNGNVLGGGDSPTYRFKDLIESAPSVQVTNNSGQKIKVKLVSQMYHKFDPLLPAVLIGTLTNEIPILVGHGPVDLFLTHQYRVPRQLPVPIVVRWDVRLVLVVGEEELDLIQPSIREMGFGH